MPKLNKLNKEIFYNIHKRLGHRTLTYNEFISNYFGELIYIYKTRYGLSEKLLFSLLESNAKTS